MEIQQVRYFMAVAKLRNFTRAAESCNVAQPSLSQQIKKLEHELGGPLFHRLGRNIVLTEQGTLLEKRAQKILQEHDNAIEELAGSFTEGGVVRLGALLTIAPYLIIGLLDEMDDSPNYQLQIEENFTEHLIAKVREGALDFAVMSSPFEEPDLLCQVIGREPFLAVMPKTHRLYRKKTLRLEDVLNEPFLELSNIHCAGQQISEICNLETTHKNTVFHSSQIETIRRLVLNGKGITILPRMALSVDKSQELGTRKISGVKMEREITLIQHPDRYMSPSTRKVIQLLKIFTKTFLHF